MSISRILAVYNTFVRREKAPLAVILSAGAALRLLMVLASGGILWPDSEAYYRFAQQIATEKNFLAHVPYRTVLYPLFLALFLARGESPAVGVNVAVVQSLFGLLSAYFLYKIARKVFGPGIAFASVFLFTMRPLQLYYEQTIHTEALFIVLLCALIHSALSSFEAFEASRRGLLPKFLGLGILSGLLALTRPIGKLLLAGLMAVQSLRGVRLKNFTGYACLALLIQFAVMVPWMAANHTSYGTFTLSIDYGLNLFHRVIDVDRMDLPEKTEFPGIKKMVRNARKTEGSTYFTVYHALRASGMPAAEADGRMKEFASECLRGNYLLFARNTIKTYAELLFWARNSVHFCGSPFGPYACNPVYKRVRFAAFSNQPRNRWEFPRYAIRWYFRIFHVPLMWLAAVLMAWGAVQFFRLEASAKKMPAAFLFVTILYFTALAALFNCADDRFRLPVDGLIFMFAAYGLSRLFPMKGAGEKNR